MVYDLVVIGGGPAGLTAGLYGARGGLKALLLEMGLPGGQVALTDLVENYPGFPQGIPGQELTRRFMDQGLRFGLEIKMEMAEQVALRDHPKRVVTAGNHYQAWSVVLATGSRPRCLKVPGEERFTGRGVSYCATCDGAFFRGKKVAVVGGGDAAVGEALFLTRYARKVVLIHRRDRLRANQSIQEKMRTNPQISLRLETVVAEILGEQLLTGLQLKELPTGRQTTEPFDGLFIFIGSEPNTGFLQGALLLDADGYVLADEDLRTPIPGVFVAGDVRRKQLRQITTAVGDGAQAAMAAERYLAGQEQAMSLAGQGLSG